jgi:hypothetical protein
VREGRPCKDVNGNLERGVTFEERFHNNSVSTVPKVLAAYKAVRGINLRDVFSNNTRLDPFLHRDRQLDRHNH